MFTKFSFDAVLTVGYSLGAVGSLLCAIFAVV